MWVKDIKIASSLWMKESVKYPEFKGWQDSYGAFTYSVSAKMPVDGCCVRSCS